MKVSAILLAGGNSKRINVSDKTTISINNLIVIEYSLYFLNKHNRIRNITVVCSDQNKLLIEKIKTKYKKLTNIVSGGDSRLNSLHSGFIKTEKHEITLIHDAARPLINDKLISESINLAINHGSGIPVTIQTDSIYISNNNTLEKSLKRSEIVSSQTPQAYETKILENLFDKIDIKNVELFYNDLPSLLLKHNIIPYTFIGDKYNLKITVDEDLEIIRKIIDQL